MAGLLDSNDPAMARALFTTGASLLANTHGVPFGKALGTSLLGGMQAHDQYNRSAVEEQLRRAQIENFQSEAEQRRAQAAKWAADQEMLRRKMEGVSSVMGGLNQRIAPSGVYSTPNEMGGEGLATSTPFSYRAPAKEQMTAVLDAARALMPYDPQMANSLIAMHGALVKESTPTSIAAGGYAATPGTAPTFMTDPKEGFTVDARGQVGIAPGALNSRSVMDAATTGAKVAATTMNTPTQIFNPATNRMEWGYLPPRGGAAASGQGGAAAGPLATFPVDEAIRRNAATESFNDWTKNTYRAAIDQGSAARAMNATLGKIAELAPQAYTGKLGELKMVAAQYAAAMGVSDKEMLSRISASKTLDALANELTLIKSATLTKGAVSDFEQRMAKATAPERSSPEEAIRFQVKTMQDMAAYRIEKAQFYQRARLESDNWKDIDAAWTLRERQLQKVPRFASYFQ